MVAVGRAIASTDEHGLTNDPFAAPLVRAVGIEAFTMMVDGKLDIAEVAPDAAAQVKSNIDEMAVRTKFFDDYFVAAGNSGIRQAVILAAGLDSRAYRLPWSDGTIVYEVDQPEVIEFKPAPWLIWAPPPPRNGAPCRSICARTGRRRSARPAWIRGSRRPGAPRDC